MNPDPNARPPHQQGPGQPSGPYGPNQYGGTPPPPPGQGGSGINPPYNPYGQDNPYGVSNPYSSDVPPTVAATPYPYTQYAPPPAQSGQPMQPVPPAPPMQNQYQGQLGYPQPSFSPPPRRSTGRTVLLISITVVVCVIIVSVLFAALATSSHDKQVAKDATATAQNNANATATTTAASMATATAAANAYPFSSNLKLDDSLAANSTSSWDTATSCAFTGGGYHISEANDNTYNVCFANKSDFSDFTYEVTVDLTKGQVAGLVFRGDANSGRSYKYLVADDGTDSLYLYKDYGAGKELFLGRDDGWNFGQKNTVGVVARGSSFSFYVNGQKVGSATDKDNTYSSGQIGLTVFNTLGTGETAEAVFTNAKVWAL